jgi:hypothetical protein
MREALSDLVLLSLCSLSSLWLKNAPENSRFPPFALRSNRDMIGVFASRDAQERCQVEDCKWTRDPLKP